MESEVRAFRSFLLAVILVLAPPGSWPATVGTPAPMAQDQVPSLAPMLERVLPAVVSIAVRGREQEPQERSEEHTSELQSLMRISYAVFCLKKKKHKTQMPNTTNAIVTQQ